MKEQCRFLVGSAGTGNAFATVQAIRKIYNTSAVIITMDTNPKHLITSTLFSNHHVKISPYQSPNFCKEIKKIVSKYRINIYIPFIDGEISIAAKMFENKEFPTDFRLQVSKLKFANICEDKLLTFKFLTKNKLSTPCVFSKKSDIKSENILCKPRFGFGSNIDIIKKNEALLILSKEDQKFIIQDLCKGPEITIDVSYSKQWKHFNYVCRERLQIKSGVCTKARLFLDEDLKTLSLKLAQKLQLHSFCFQVMKYKNKWAIIDINPRLGAGSSMSKAAGFDFFGAMIAILTNNDPKPFFINNFNECYVTRQYVDFLM